MAASTPRPYSKALEEALMARLIGFAFLLSAALTAPGTGERLKPSSFGYLGAFAIDGNLVTDPSWNAFGQRGMSLDREGDPEGSDPFSGSLWVTGHDWKRRVVELSIPIPAAGIQDFDRLPRTTLLTPPTQFSDGCTGASEWLADVEVHGDHLWASCANNYNVTAKDLPEIMWRRRRSDLSDLQGPFHAGPVGTERFHSNRQGMYLFSIPRDWADSHLDGRTLATGFSRNSHGGVMGPTIFAFDPEDPSDAYDLLRYRQHPPCFRDQSRCDYPEYTACDYWGSAVWIRIAGIDTLLMAGQKFDGGSSVYVGGGWDCGDGFGEIIFYDPVELAARTTGGKSKIKPWKILPYQTWRPKELWSANHPVGGMAFDQKEGLFYMVEKFAGPDGRAIIHVYRIGTSAKPSEQATADPD